MVGMSDRLWQWLMRRWPRCRPYDTRRRLCLGYRAWNGRCHKHVRRASGIGEAI